MRWRLALLMFLQFAVPGTLAPVFSLWLKELHFTPEQIGWMWTAQSLAALGAPMLAGQIADRWFPAERCLAVCACIAGVTLWIMAGLTTPVAIFVCSLTFWLVIVLATTLGSGLCFAHLPSPDRDFGPARMWGTVGWASVGWLLGLWFLYRGESYREWTDSFRLGSVLAFVLAGYAFTLPHTPPEHRFRSWLAPLSALHLMRSRAFAIYWMCGLGVCLTLAFSTQLTPLLLDHLEVEPRWLTPVLTISQSTEILSLAILPMLLLRLGVRGTMLLGLCTWLAALTILAIGQPRWFVIGSLALIGLCICCFMVAGQVFANRRAQGDIRTSAQALLGLMGGLGLLLGNLLVGWVHNFFDEKFPPTFAVGAGIALILVVVFYAGFVDEGTE